MANGQHTAKRFWQGLGIFVLCLFLLPIPLDLFSAFFLDLSFEENRTFVGFLAIAGAIVITWQWWLWTKDKAKEKAAGPPLCNVCKEPATVRYQNIRFKYGTEPFSGCRCETHAAALNRDLVTIEPIKNPKPAASTTAPRTAANTTAPPTAAPDITVQLKRLADLHQSGALTDEEFASAKAILLRQG